MIEQGLFQLVTSDPGVQAAVGVDANGIASAYWVLAPQGVPVPYLVFSRIGTTDTYDMAGSIGFREAKFQVVSYSSAYYGSRNMSKAVRQLLQDYAGTLPDTNSTVVQAVVIDKDWDARYEEGSKAFIFGAYLQFRVWYYDK